MIEDEGMKNEGNGNEEDEEKRNIVLNYQEFQMPPS